MKTWHILAIGCAIAFYAMGAVMGHIVEVAAGVAR